ncbi:hypothetical protein [Peribacillus simplex]|uniref:hypothetical protein n=1 Tax=Peribacillus simplex TaxID=1478 RepID=UPI0011AA5C72|nr:hypothetical protein [Peribacillus simplex]
MKNRTITYIFSTLFLILLLLFSIINSSFALFISIFIPYLVVQLFALFYTNNRNLGLAITIIYGFNITMVLIVYQYYINKYGIPYSIGIDDYNFEREALYLVNNNYSFSEMLADEKFQFHNSLGYVYFLSKIIFFSNLIGDYHTLIPRFLNTFFLSILGILLYKFISDNLNNRKVALFGFLFIGLSPLMVFNSANIYRDTITTLCVFLIYSLSRWILNNWSINNIWYNFYSLLFISLSFIVLYWFRRPILYLMLLVIILNLIFRVRIKLRLFLFFLSLPIAFIWTDLTLLKEYFENYSQYRISLGDGISSAIFNAPITYGWILRSAYLLISPFYGLNFEFYKLYLTLGVFLQIFLSFYFFRGIKHLVKSKEWPFLITYLMIFFMIAIVTFGDRHIMMLYPFSVIIISYGMKSDKVLNKRILLYFSTLLLLIAFGLSAYLSYVNYF